LGNALTFLLKKKSKQKKTLKKGIPRNWQTTKVSKIFMKVFEDSKETFFKKFLWQRSFEISETGEGHGV